MCVLSPSAGAFACRRSIALKDAVPGDGTRPVRVLFMHVAELLAQAVARHGDVDPMRVAALSLSARGIFGSGHARCWRRPTAKKKPHRVRAGLSPPVGNGRVEEARPRRDNGKRRTLFPLRAGGSGEAWPMAGRV